MPTFNNLKELSKFLNEKIADALQNEVAQTVKQTMSEQVHKTVYDVYEPKKYIRSGDHGGLSDTENMESKMIDDNTLSVRDTRNDEDRDVAYIVESGKGYLYNVPKALTDGRPFTEKTAEELEMSKQHVKALKVGLKRQGLDVD